MSKLSVVIITLNEEKRIRRTLESIKWADEIVIVDAESIDKTVDICKEYGAKVHKRKWTGYGDQWNYGINNSEGPWILIVSADMVFDCAIVEEIINTINNVNSKDVYKITNNNYFMGGSISPQKSPLAQIRLFKKGTTYFSQRAVHEGIICNVNEIGIIINRPRHYSYENIAHYIDKFNKYTTLESIQITKTGRYINDISILLHMFGSPIKAFTSRYMREGLMFCGLPGFIFSTLSAFYSFVSWIKVWELKKIK